jgi:hypothetical protein
MPWRVLIIREWRTAPPNVAHLAETFAAKAKAEAARKECEAEGPFHSLLARNLPRGRVAYGS